jgi:hypothetical protein
MEHGPIKLTRSVVRVLLVIVLCTAVLAAVIARAQSADPGAQAGAEPAGHAHHRGAAEAAGDGHHVARHHVMVMAAPGVADVGGGYLAGGVGYEYRLPYLNDTFGVGAMAELMLGTGHGAHPMLMATATVHPFRGLFLMTAMGASHAHDDASERTGNASGCGDGWSSADAVVRLSAGYDVHAGSIMVTPHVNVDLGGSMTRAVSAGFGIGRMF